MRAALSATKGVPIPMGVGSVTFEDDRVPRYGAVMLTVRSGKFVIAQ